MVKNMTQSQASGTRYNTQASDLPVLSNDILSDVLHCSTPSLPPNATHQILGPQNTLANTNLYSANNISLFSEGGISGPPSSVRFTQETGTSYCPVFSASQQQPPLLLGNTEFSTQTQGGNSALNFCNEKFNQYSISYQQYPPSCQSTMAGSSMAGSNMAGSNMAGSNMAGSSMAGSNMAGSSMAGSSMAGSNMAGSSMAGSNMAGSNMAGSNMAGSNMAGSNMAASNMAGSNGGSIAINKPQNQVSGMRSNMMADYGYVSNYNPGYHSFDRPPTTPSYSGFQPQKINTPITQQPQEPHYKYQKVLHHHLPFSSKAVSSESPVPVAKFPQKSSFPGKFDFSVNFPEVSPKHLATMVNERRYLFTKPDNHMTAVIHHTAVGATAVGATTGPSVLRIRVFVVYTSESESTKAVEPCKNHRLDGRPSHMMVATAVGSPEYHDSPHPSIVVTPSLKEESAVPSFNAREYCVQLKFLCRNSCLTRKELTLVLQLETENYVVLGRDSMELKVSSCPRRDHKNLLKQLAAAGGGANNSRNPNKMKRTRSLVTDCVVQPSSLDFAILNSNDSLNGLTSVERVAKEAARLVYMNIKFKEYCEEEHCKAGHEFDNLWGTKMWRHRPLVQEDFVNPNIMS